MQNKPKSLSFWAESKTLYGKDEYNNIFRILYVGCGQNSHYVLLLNKYVYFFVYDFYNSKEQLLKDIKQAEYDLIFNRKNNE